MTEAPAPLDATLLEDWITIWHSELAAAIVDREAQEVLLRLLDLWAAEARRAAAALERLARPAPPPRPAPAAAAPAEPGCAPDPRDAVIAGLLDRVAELERRLAGPG